MDNKYIGLVKRFYNEKGIEQIEIVEVVRMIHFAEWLEQCAAQQDICQECGAKLTPDNPWCQNCGARQP